MGGFALDIVSIVLVKQPIAVSFLVIEHRIYILKIFSESTSLLDSLQPIHVLVSLALKEATILVGYNFIYEPNL